MELAKELGWDNKKLHRSNWKKLAFRLRPLPLSLEENEVERIKSRSAGH